jgi:ribosomal protein S27E
MRCRTSTRYSYVSISCIHQVVIWLWAVFRAARIMHARHQHKPASHSIHYERRRPEETTLYRLIQEHLETFLAQAQAQTGSALLQFVQVEFDAYLKCGILAHGFLRLRCAACAHEKLVAFSCKGRGICPSCGGRRMAQAG